MAQPVKESWKRESDGQSADLFEVYDYPIIAKCSVCEQQIRAETFLKAFEHLDPSR